MAEEPIMPQALRIKTPEDELMVLSQLSETTAFVVLKRVVRRFVEQSKNSAFLLHENDPQLPLKLGKLTATAEGMNTLIKIISGARGELAKRNGDRV